MWCSRCAQHVAAIVGDAEGAALCASCGEPLDAFVDLAGAPPEFAASRSASQVRTRPSVGQARPALPAFAYSRARLEHIGRRLDALARLSAVDQANARRSMAKPPVARTSPVKAPRLRDAVSKVGLFCGLATLTCGIALSAWSLLGDESLLWRIGLPTALLGQFLLLVVLAGQWNRAADERGESRRTE